MGQWRWLPSGSMEVSLAHCFPCSKGEMHRILTHADAPAKLPTTVKADICSSTCTRTNFDIVQPLSMTPIPYINQPTQIDICPIHPNPGKIQICFGGVRFLVCSPMKSRTTFDNKCFQDLPRMSCYQVVQTLGVVSE